MGGWNEQDKCAQEDDSDLRTETSHISCNKQPSPQRHTNKSVFVSASALVCSIIVQ